MLNTCLVGAAWRSIKTGSEIENRRIGRAARKGGGEVMLQIVTPTRVTSVSTCVLMRVRALWGILDVSPSDTPSFNVETTLFTFRPTLRLRQPTSHYVQPVCLRLALDTRCTCATQGNDTDLVHPRNDALSSVS